MRIEERDEQYTIEVELSLGSLQPEDLLEFRPSTCLANVNNGLSDLQRFLNLLNDHSDVLQMSASFLKDVGKIHPIAQLTVMLVTIPYTILKNVQEYQEKVAKIQKHIQGLLPLLADISMVNDEGNLQSKLEILVETILEIARCFGEYRKKSHGGKVWTAQFKKELDECSEKLRACIGHLKLALSAHTARAVDESRALNNLKKLIPSYSEDDTLPPPCYSGSGTV
ncbi:hypothetical protein M422DRAFT_783850 [Sphaerobolus stellatus SS14]|uniref:Uncharacterized protein n=1 Tax=Sphaerobolus stellatus (strain SS14) TaxID=990650 RepID=A0A0C9V0M8_SPHS4|nr:hypothetical protein M422DRAFT_783850 [Sphaerobolus stellatus SS14]